MSKYGTFPFGDPVIPLTQQDRTTKKVFVLGVYASAVHAKWLDASGKIVVRALAVASEPYIFWKGEGAAEIISKIKVPSEAGALVAADLQFNGPSGHALDDGILSPLGLERKDAWLCDLVPYSCINPQQKKAVIDRYNPWVEKGILPASTTKPVPSVLSTPERVIEITKELLASGAEFLVLLGDEPIKWYLSKISNKWKRLTDFGESESTYGTLHSIELEGKTIQVLPLAHPRQIAKLGMSSDKWYRLHQAWLKTAPNLLK